MVDEIDTDAKLEKKISENAGAHSGAQPDEHNNAPAEGNLPLSDADSVSMQTEDPKPEIPLPPKQKDEPEEEEAEKTQTEEDSAGKDNESVAAETLSKDEEISEPAPIVGSLINKETAEQLDKDIETEEVSIDDLHKDIEEKLKEQGFIFDKTKFVVRDEHLTFGGRLADKIAKFGGSWTFITIFLIFIVIWISVNFWILLNKGFDPYPFILLNLILSCIASIQAPVIMMSQNRQAEKERRQAEINLEKDIVDFKQDRLDLILDQKEWKLLTDMQKRITVLQDSLDEHVKISSERHHHVMKHVAARTAAASRAAKSASAKANVASAKKKAKSAVKKPAPAKKKQAKAKQASKPAKKAKQAKKAKKRR